MLKHGCLLVLLIWLPSVALGQTSASEYELDLADAGFKVKVRAGTRAKLRITHRLPSQRYRIEVTQRGMVRPFELGVFKDVTRGAARISGRCEDLLKAQELLLKTDETEFRNALVQARSLSPDSVCTRRIAEIEKSATFFLTEEYEIAEGQTLTITVKRIGNNKTWVYEISSVEDRQWLIHFGFSFLLDRDEAYFTAVDPGGAGFLVTRAEDSKDLIFEPTVCFSYVPKRYRDNPFVPKFSAGLGVNIERRLVFTGSSWIIGDNVSLFVGVAGHEQTRLKGIYQVGQLLQDNLQPDQLVDERFNVNVIFGIGFRFSSNPFGKEENKI